MTQEEHKTANCAQKLRHGVTLRIDLKFLKFLLKQRSSARVPLIALIKFIVHEHWKDVLKKILTTFILGQLFGLEKMEIDAIFFSHTKGYCTY